MVSEAAAVNEELGAVPAVKPVGLLQVLIYLPELGLLVAARLRSVHFVGHALFAAKKPQIFYLPKFLHTRVFLYIPFQTGSRSDEIGKEVAHLANQNLRQLRY